MKSSWGEFRGQVNTLCNLKHKDKMNRIVIIVCEDSSTVHGLTEYEDCQSPIGGAHVEVPIMFSNVEHIWPVTVPPLLLVQ